MHSKVQAILDKDWPDNFNGSYPHYGDLDKNRALIRLAMHAEDVGDKDLYDQAVERASSVIFPRTHLFIHEKKKKILIFKEKYGDWYFVTTNATEVSKALLSVLNQRLEDNLYMDELYGDDLPKEGEDPNQTDMFKNNELPKTDKQTVQDIINRAQSGEPGCLFKAGKTAYRFLQNRTKFEYEELIVEYPSKITFNLTPS